MTTACLLKEAGAQAAVIEADRAVEGVTGSTTGKLTSLHGLADSDLQSTLDEGGARTRGEAAEATPTTDLSAAVSSPHLRKGACG